MSFLAPSNASALVSSLLCCTKVHRKVSVASTLALLEASALMSLSEADQQSVRLLYTRRMSKLGVIRNQLKWRAYHQFRSLFLAVIYIYICITQLIITSSSPCCAACEPVPWPFSLTAPVLDRRRGGSNGCGLVCKDHTTS